MKSAYPSSQSFFDDTSDSIKALDLNKCRESSSFSSLADLFSNPSTKSELFPHARASAFLPEVRFPAKKKRECEERTSIWHEWGSGESQSEHVAQESYGFSTENLGGKSFVMSSGNFPNLGSANISFVDDGFQFPARKKREEGSSWREKRTSWQDWSSSVAPKKSKVLESTPIVGSITDMYLNQPCSKRLDVSATSKSSPFSSLGSASEEVSFPARKKREERSFWQESSSDGTASDCEVIITPRDSTTGVSSLADMYLNIAGSKRSSLFSNGSFDGSEVVFPKRKERADRNVWRDWTNTGYCDYFDETGYCDENSTCSASRVTTEVDDLAEAQEDSSSGSGKPGVEGSNRMPVRLSGTENLPYSEECVLRSSAHKTDRDVTDPMQVLRQASEAQVCEPVSGSGRSVADNVDASGCPEPLLESGAGRRAQSTSSRGERTMDGEESCYTSVEDMRTDDVVEEFRFPLCRSEQRNTRNVFKYPPPLRSISKEGQSCRVPSHMPWVQLQHIRSEGRFVLQEVKVTQPVVFQPIRKEGRLVLELIGQDYKNGCSRPSFGVSSSPVADEKATPVSGEVDSDDSGTMKTEEVDSDDSGTIKTVEVDSGTMKTEDEMAPENTEANQSMTMKTDDRVVQKKPQVRLKTDEKVVEEKTQVRLKANEKVVEKSEDGLKTDDKVVEKAQVRSKTVDKVVEEKADSRLKTDYKLVREKAEARQSLDRAALVQTERKKISSKGWPFFGLAEKEKKKSSKVFPIYWTPTEILPGEEVLFARAEEAAAGMWDRKFNFREMCYMAEEIVPSSHRRVFEGEKSVGVDGALIQDRSPPWLLGKVLPEDRRFDARMRNATERLGQTGNIITVRGARETAALRVHFQCLPRTSSLRNGLNSSRMDGEVSLPRSRSIRSSYLTDVANMDSGKEEDRGRAGDGRISVCQGTTRDSVMSLPSYEFFRRPPMSRPDIPGESDPKLSNYKPPVAATFSCAEVMGKQHHEKNFWEQQPCVS